MGVMKLVIVLFFVVFSNFLASARKFHVPVLIWGREYENTRDGSFPSLARLDSDKFLNHFLKNVHKINEKPTIVAFVEETLSVEDFSVQDVKSDGSFPLLKSLLNNYKREFLTSVENPVSALTGPEMKSYGFSFSELNERNLETTNDIGKNNAVYIVNLEDANVKDDRPQMLHRHDQIISQIFDVLSKNNKNVIGVLTGRVSSWTEPEEIIRVRRQANETTPNETTLSTTKAPTPAKPTNGIILETKTALIYSKTPPVLTLGDKKIVLENPVSMVHDDREKWQRAIFSYATDIGKVNLRFRFENTSNYFWSLSQVELEDPQKKELILLSTKRSISAPYDSSYHASTPVVFSNDSNSLVFSDMQVQPYKSPSDVKKFGDAEGDTPFFTPPIWTGLIVTGLITLILMWGLSMIIDIRTMDQFDDPKGKTITVNVSD